MALYCVSTRVQLKEKYKNAEDSLETIEEILNNDHYAAIKSIKTQSMLRPAGRIMEWEKLLKG